MESVDVVKDPRMYDWLVKVPRDNVTYAPFAHNIQFDGDFYIFSQSFNLKIFSIHEPIYVHVKQETLDFQSF